jgi:LysM repeat protein
VEKVAAQAGKAAPAMAIAGALVTVPQAQHALAATGKPAATAASHQNAATAKATLDSVTMRHAAGKVLAGGTHYLVGSTYYKVRSGDTLSKIAGRYYGKAGDWQWLYHENDQRISDPDTIYPGQEVFVPTDPPANYALPHYQPRHDKAAFPASDVSDSGRTVVAQSASTSDHVASVSGGAYASASRGSTALSGTLGCSGLEQIWQDAGGNPSDAFMAAEIAMAESGGNQYALSPTDDYGYWQINASNGALATFNAYGNARAAVILSGNGSNWGAWTTYTSGAYTGRC